METALSRHQHINFILKMKKTFLLLTTCLLGTSLSYSQILNFGQPSLNGTINHVVAADIDGTNTDLSTTELRFNAPIYKFDVAGWTGGLGVTYTHTNLNFASSTLLDESELHSLDVPFFLTRQSSENLSWILMGTPNLSGDYNDIDSDTMNYSLLGGARYKRSDSFEWLFGFFYTTGFEDDLFVPAIGFIWDISDDSQLTFVGPFVRYSYDLSNNITWSLNGGFAGNRWDTQSDYASGVDDREFRLRSYRISTQIEMNLSEKQELFAGIGFDLAREVEIKNGIGTSLIEEDVEEAPFFEIGYRYSF